MLGKKCKRYYLSNLCNDLPRFTEAFQNALKPSTVPAAKLLNNPEVAKTIDYMEVIFSSFAKGSSFFSAPNAGTETSVT